MQGLSYFWHDACCPDLVVSQDEPARASAREDSMHRRCVQTVRGLLTPSLLKFRKDNVYTAETIEDESLIPDGPPIVKKNFEWPPHRYPSTDYQSFANQPGKSACFEGIEYLANG